MKRNNSRQHKADRLIEHKNRLLVRILRALHVCKGCNKACMKDVNEALVDEAKRYFDTEREVENEIKERKKANEKYKRIQAERKANSPV